MPIRPNIPRRLDAVGRAVWRLAARDGLEAVTYRRVAAEVGFASSQLQRYFPTRDKLLRHAWRQLDEEQTRTILRSRMLALHTGEWDSARWRASWWCRQVLPLDESRRLWWLVGFAYVNRALRLGEPSAPFRLDTELLAGQLGELLDDERQAVTLAAITQGLGLAMITGAVDAPMALRVLEAQIDALV